MKKTSFTLLITTLICFSASIFGMKRNIMTINNQEGQTQANQEKQIIEHLWLDEFIVYIAAHSQPEEKNMLMRVCKQFKKCLTQGRDLIIAINPWAVTQKDCQNALFHAVRVDDAYPDGAGKNAYYLAQRLLDTQLVSTFWIKNILSRNPLHYAQEKNNKIMEDLLKKNMIHFINSSHFFEILNDYINLPNPNITPLQEAVYQGNEKEVKKLLALEEADPNVALTDGITLLHIAAHENHTEVIKLLLATDKIDINKKNNTGTTPVLYAMEKKCCFEIIQLLIITETDPNQTNICGDTLRFAIQNNDIEIVKLLLTKNKIDLNQTDNEKNGPLHDASLFDHTKIAQLLINAGANVNQVNDEGYTPLHYASHNNNTEITQCLINAGANINQPDADGDTPFHIVEKCDIEVITLLINTNKANINQKNNNGETPLYLASLYNETNIVKLFINAGADISLKNNDGKSALDIAQENGHHEIVELLQKQLQQDQDINIISIEQKNA